MKRLLIAILMIGAGGALRAGPTIIVSPANPALRLENVRVDQQDGRIRGTAYLNRGHPAPSLPHVDVYGLDAAGQTIYLGCDKLQKSLLTRLPRVARGRDSFSVPLPSDLSRFAVIKVVASSGHDGCAMKGDRVFKIF